MMGMFARQVGLGDTLRVACAVLLGLVLAASGAPLAEREALDRLSVWMDGHPVMGCVAGDAIASTVAFPESGGSYSVYVVAFSPAGYAVLNSDDRLPLVIAFSASSGVNLADSPDNAFRAALLAHVAKRRRTCWARWTPRLAPDRSYRRARRPPCDSQESSSTAPISRPPGTNATRTTCFVPMTPAASAYYGYRAPTGCTPTAYAQVLYYHRWPLPWTRHVQLHRQQRLDHRHAQRLTSSTPFNWAAMQTAYEPWRHLPARATTRSPTSCTAWVSPPMPITRATAPPRALKRWASASIRTYFYYEPIGYAWSQAALLPDFNEQPSRGLSGRRGGARPRDRGGRIAGRRRNRVVPHQLRLGRRQQRLVVRRQCGRRRDFIRLHLAQAHADGAPDRRCDGAGGGGEPATLEWLLPVHPRTGGRTHPDPNG
jgi:hypothetical protein